MLSLQRPSHISPFETEPKISVPSAWKNPDLHWLAVMQDPWYRHLAQIQHQVHRAINEFFSSEGLITLCLPITTSSISSPMGLGSDSLPVEVELFGIKTYLADSMQFLLEYGCRLHSNGVFYLMPSFRGESTDDSHLPQFYHAEAEIQGNLTTAMTLASRMTHFLTEWLLNYCTDSILALAGDIAHAEGLMQLNGHFPEIRMRDALSLLKSNKEKWIKRHELGFATLTRAGERVNYIEGLVLYG